MKTPKSEYWRVFLEESRRDEVKPENLTEIDIVPLLIDQTIKGLIEQEPVERWIALQGWNEDIKRF